MVPNDAAQTHADHRGPESEAVLTALGEVIRVISRPGFDLGDALQTIIRSAVELSRADFGNILRPDEGGDVFRVVAYHGDVSAEYWKLATNTPYRPDRGTLIGRVLIERQPVHVHDVLNDPAYTAWQLQQAGGYRTILGVPMLRESEPIGLFVVWRNRVEPFTPQEISLLSTFADQAVLAIDTLRLLQTVEHQRSQLALYAPQVAALLASRQGEALLAGHRREITAMFADLRGFTSFAEGAEPEEVLDVLREYHQMVGSHVVASGGTVEHFAGDGLMAFWNDPLPIADHQLVAVHAALEIRAGFEGLASGWRRRGHDLGLGLGMATGFATLGRIGFEGRFDYGAVGNVVILASRLSDLAAPSEILVSQRLNAALEGRVDTDPMAAEQSLKGFGRPVRVFRVDRRAGPAGN